MNYNDALVIVNTSGTVQRPGSAFTVFKGSVTFISISNDDAGNMVETPTLIQGIIRKEGKVYSNYEPSQDDLDASDWFEV